MIKRKDNKKILEILKRKKFEVITVTGRRRVGKTTTVKELFKTLNDGVCFIFTGDLMINNFEATKNTLSFYLRTHLKEKNLLKEKEITDLILKIENIKTWDMFFNLICEICHIFENVYVFFDEVNWFGKDFLSNLTHKINELFMLQDNLKLILASSLNSWIKNEFFKNSGGLYHRTINIKLEPFSFQEIKQYLLLKNNKLSSKTIFEYYLMFGGIAYYYQLLDLNLSFENNLLKIIENKSLILQEKEILLKSLFKEDKYVGEIINSLCQSKSLTFNEIKDKIIKEEMTKKTKETIRVELYKVLEDLEDSGFIYSSIPEGYSERNKTYGILDLFSFFNYFWWGKENKNLSLNSLEYNNWKGFAFECFIFQNIDLIKKHIGINGETEKYLNVNSNNIKMPKNKDYKNYIQKNGFQIDCLLKQTSKIENHYSIIECKYYKNKIKIEGKIVEELNKKALGIELINKKNVVNIILVSLNGSVLIKKPDYNIVEVNFLDIIENL